MGKDKLQRQWVLGLLRHVVGEAPPALQLAAYCTAENVIGIFHQTGSNYLLRVRARYAGSIISHLLSQIAGRMLRDAE